MNRTAWIIIALAVVVGLGGLVFFTKKDQVDVNQVDPWKLVESTESELGDNVYGKTDSKVVLIEYADYQCGGCAAANGKMSGIKEIYKDKITYVFRHFPLTNGHPNALAAATVAEAAGLQGKFWEMTDHLYANQQDWSGLSAEKRGSVFESYAQQMGLNMEKFRSSLTDGRIQRKISLDRALAGKVRVNETPTFFIGNEKMSNEVVTDIMQADGKQLMDRLDAALKAAGETPPARN
jgi:protein-disulfide isomerase